MTIGQEYVLLGMGNPLLDISAVVDEALLMKYGLEANNAILAEDKHKPLYEELVKNHKVEYVAGGATQNSLRGAQWMLPPKSTVYIGCVGKDEYGKQLKAAAAADGLRTEYLEDPAVPTGTCGVLITGTNRSLVANLSAANHYKVDHVKKPEIWQLVKDARFYYIGGFFLTVSPETILEVAKHAAEQNKVFSMNLSAPFLSQFFTKQMDACIPYWDILFGNETEAVAFAESHSIASKDVKDIAIAISKMPKANAQRPRMVVFTQGAQPTIVVVNGKVTEYPVIPIAPKDIVDTNGAGDAFVGGFLSRYVQGKSMEECVAAGNYVAHVVIRRSGPTYPREAPTFSFKG